MLGERLLMASPGKNLLRTAPMTLIERTQVGFLSTQATITPTSGMSVDGSSKLVVIIDDHEAMQDSLRDLMEAAGFEVCCFGCADAFLESDLPREAGCLIVDIRMPKMSGLQLQAKLKEKKYNIPIIFVTAYGDARTRIQAMREGAVEFLAKPFDHQVLLKRVRAALET
jgi:FixJ family two-component response regulator